MTDVKVMSVTFLLPAEGSRDRDRFSHGSDVPYDYISHPLGFYVVQSTLHHHVAAKSMVKIRQTTLGVVDMGARMLLLLDLALHPHCVQCPAPAVPPPIVHRVELDLSTSGN